MSGGGYELRETYCNKCSKVTHHRRYDNPELIEDKNYLFCDVCNKKQLRPEIADGIERLKQMMETEQMNAEQVKQGGEYGSLPLQIKNMGERLEVIEQMGYKVFRESPVVEGMYTGDVLVLKPHRIRIYVSDVGDFIYLQFPGAPVVEKVAEALKAEDKPLPDARMIYQKLRDIADPISIKVDHTFDDILKAIADWIVREFTYTQDKR